MVLATSFRGLFMNRRIRCPSLAGACLILALVGTACQPDQVTQNSDSPAAKATTSSAPSTNRQTYEVKGVVKEVMLERKKAKIAHEEIPGYMEAMTMLLDVKDAVELNGLQPGDNITFRMVVLADDGWIENVKKLD